MSKADDGVVNRIGTDDEGRAILTMPYDEQLAQKAVQKGLARQTDNKTDSDAERSTPDPTGEHQDGQASRGGGPIKRFNDVFTDLGSVQLEALGLDGFEISKAAAKRRNEMYRNEFPLLVPRFALRCEGCGAEFDEAVEACPTCTRALARENGVDVAANQTVEEIDEAFHAGDLRPPDPEQKRDGLQIAESVNKEGQSLRDLYRLLEDDQSRLGVSLHIVKWNYAVATGDSPAFSEGDVLRESVDELIRGDPKRVVPVVDENGRVGGYWWACPLHRGKQTEGGISKSPGRCETCNAELREVYFIERENAAAGSRKPVKYYFDSEVVTWAHHQPRLNGLDGLSPVHHVWLKQSILHWMDVYGAAFYDPDSDRYPNKFMVVHTTNPDTWERNFQKAEEDAKENPYSQQIMMNEYSGDSNSTPELQVVDLMNDDLLGQDDQIKQRYKSDIRTQFGVTDVFDSELEDAGGLNNEGLQMEVTDREVASFQHDLATGPLDDLAKLLGLTDWQFAFVPPRETETKERMEKVDLGGKAAKNGLDASWEGGEVAIEDGEFEEPSSDGPPMPGGFGQAADRDLSTEDTPESVFATFNEDTLDTLDEKLAEGYRHIVWADGVDQKASPFWDEDEAVPEFVAEAIRAVIDAGGAVYQDIEGFTNSEIAELAELLGENLTQRQGWSLDSITSDIRDRFDVDADRAEDLARTESARVLNQAREEGYEESGSNDGLYKWTGPSDHRETECCAWLKEQTKEGVTMERLRELAREAAARFFPDLDYNDDWVLHPHERHTFTRTFDVGKADVETAWPETPPVPGTFAKADAGSATTGVTN